ncbi:MAG: hypothetical protein AMXMBFR36_00570 [Acidobacteriota bacterium]
MVALLIPIGRPSTADSLDSPLTDFHPTWIWTQSSLQPNTDALAIADTGVTGQAEIVMLGWSNYWFTLQLTGGALRQTWSSFGSSVALRGLVIVEGEPPLAIIWTSAEALVFDSRTKKLVRTLQLPSEEIVTLAVANIDGFDGNELLACDADAMYVLDFQSGQLLATRFGFGGSRIQVGEVDGDSALEIALAGNPLGGYIIDGASLEVEWGLLEGFGGEAWLVDVHGDSRAELVHGGYDSLEARDPRTGAQIWSKTGLVFLGTTIATLADSSTAIVAYSYFDGGIVALSVSDGSLLWTIPLVDDLDHERIAIGELDGDPSLEVVLASSGERTVAVFDIDSQELEAEERRIEGPYLGLSVADLDADGFDELSTIAEWKLSGSPHWNRLTFDSQTHSIEYLGDPGSAHDGIAVGSAVIEVDGDPALELCAAFDDGPGTSGVRCLDGLTSEVDFSWPLSLDEIPRSLDSGDLDGDGLSELLVLSDDGLVHVFGGVPLGWLWSSVGLAENNDRSALRVGQADLDTQLEIVLAGVGSQRDAIAILDGLSGTLEYGPFHVDARVAGVCPASVSAPAVVFVGTFGGDVAALDLSSGQLASPIASFGGPIRGLRCADLDRDGLHDLAIGAEGRLFVHAGGDSSVWESPFLDPLAAEENSIYVADLGANSVPDLLVNSRVGFVVFEAPLFVLFSDGFESGDTAQWSSTQN